MDRSLHRPNLGSGGFPEPAGLKVRGNIDLSNRPLVRNPDGSISTILSASRGTDKGEVLYPLVYDGKRHTDAEAWQHYKDTGQHLGIFDTPDHATAYAKSLHEQEAKRIGQP